MPDELYWRLDRDKPYFPNGSRPGNRRYISGVYAFIHLPTGTRYIGCSSDMEHRFRQHLYELGRGIHHCRGLQAYWQRDGEKSFAFTVLVLCPAKEIHARERELIAASTTPLFNEQMVLSVEEMRKLPQTRKYRKRRIQVKPDPEVVARYAHVETITPEELQAKLWAQWLAEKNT